MSVRDHSRHLIDERPLTVEPSLAVALGLHRAHFVQQLHYWLRKPGAHVHRGRRWIYNTYEGWHEQFPFWQPETIRKLVKSLEADGIIETTTEFNADKRDRTKWYTIDYEALDALFDAPGQTAGDGPEHLPGGPEDLPDAPDDLPGGAEKGPDQPEDPTGSQPEDPTGSIYTETTGIDSVLQTGGGPDRTPPPEGEPPKAEKPGAFGVRELMERVAAARDRGAPIHDPPDVANYGRFFATRFKRHDLDVLLWTLDYLVAKAGGEIEGEPKAWCGFDTALDRVLEGWRPADAGRASQGDPTPEQLADHTRAEREFEELLRLEGLA